MTKIDIEFLEKCMPTENRKVFFVPYSLWGSHLETIKQLQNKGYSLSVSQVDSLDNI